MQLSTIDSALDALRAGKPVLVADSADRENEGDAVIAATALTHNLPLVTRNTQDFKHVAGLRLLDPFATAT